MERITNWICKNKIMILIISLLLLIPSVIGIYKTRVNYDILVYLPDDIETIKGEKILTKDFGIGSYAISIIDNMNGYDITNLEEDMRKIDGVNKVMSLYDAIGTTIPTDILPNNISNKLVKDNSTLLLTTFKGSISSDETINAIQELRKITKDEVKIGGMSSVVLDTKNLADSEVIIYVIIAVILCIIVLMCSLDSYFVSILLLLNIGIAILYNMGSNIMLGEISYITKAISSILQLGVTTDFSIFLYHKYEDSKKKYKDKNKAMSNAIKDTFVSVTGSSLTTIAGFLALCTMTLTLGKDIGIVMAKGVFFGVICVLTLFPVLILCFDKLIEKTRHKVMIPKFKHTKNFIIKNYKLIFIIFIILMIPAWYGQKNTKSYYNLDSTLPNSLMSISANNEISKKYNIVSPEIILINRTTRDEEIDKMITDIKKIKGIDLVLSSAAIDKLEIPDNFFDDGITSMIENDKYKLILVNSTYETATDKLNNQIADINKIVKKYDKKAITAGVGPLMKDLVETSNTDFHNVNYVSIAVIFIIMLIVLKSISLPFILVFVIEGAIFINMAIPFYTNTTIPFIASIVIGTIQLGATIDYAILMTTKYLESRKQGKKKEKAIDIALSNSIKSIFVSGMCFFAATIGVGIYSKLEMIGSLCTLISRGAIISMIIVIFVLPSFLTIFDKLICKTTLGFKKEDNYEK